MKNYNSQIFKTYLFCDGYSPGFVLGFVLSSAYRNINSLWSLESSN